MAQPDGKKIFFENLSGAGKAIAVLTSGGDAQGKTLRRGSKRVGSRINNTPGPHLARRCHRSSREAPSPEGSVAQLIRDSW